MSYLSCDMSYKVSANGSSHSTGKNSSAYNRGPAHNNRGVKGYFQYLARDCDVLEGREVYGWHESIDVKETTKNITMVRQEDGTYFPASRWEDLNEAFERRIADVEVKRHLNGKDVVLKGHKALKKDSCVIRPIVLQGGKSDRFYELAVDLICERVGAENVIGYSIHRDETSTHCHVLVVPVAGHSLNQKKVLPSNGKEMKAFHEFMRSGMRAYGYEHIEIENKPHAYTNTHGTTEDLTKEQREIYEHTKEIASDFKDFENLEDILNNMFENVVASASEEEGAFIRMSKKIKDKDGVSLYDKIREEFIQEQKAEFESQSPQRVGLEDLLERMGYYQEDEDEENIEFE